MDKTTPQEIEKRIQTLSNGSEMDSVSVIVNRNLQGDCLEAFMRVGEYEEQTCVDTCEQIVTYKGTTHRMSYEYKTPIDKAACKTCCFIFLCIIEHVFLLVLLRGGVLWQKHLLVPIWLLVVCIQVLKTFSLQQDKQHKKQLT